MYADFALHASGNVGYTHHQTRERDMQVWQAINGEWVVLLGWTGRQDSQWFKTKAEAEARMQELKAGR